MLEHVINSDKVSMVITDDEEFVKVFECLGG